MVVLEEAKRIDALNPVVDGETTSSADVNRWCYKVCLFLLKRYIWERESALRLSAEIGRELNDNA